VHRVGQAEGDDDDRDVLQEHPPLEGPVVAHDARERACFTAHPETAAARTLPAAGEGGREGASSRVAGAAATARSCISGEGTSLLPTGQIASDPYHSARMTVSATYRTVRR
jgi:hypothetical protein